MTMPIDPQSQQFMRRCLELANLGWGKTHPNPMVGALIVEDGRVVSEGFHAQAGGDHAEVAALKNLGRTPSPGAILFITLEPCSTVGRTGACTEAILSAGLKRVVIGGRDPNPAHAGRGILYLREAGVEVQEGVLAEECDDLNIVFNHWITRQRSFFAAKVATTMDGKIACRTGASKWITEETARRDVMRWRRLFPAIGVGTNTVLQDDPRLTSRLDEEEWCPIRFVFDGLLRTAHPKDLPSLYTDEFRDRTIVVTTEHAGTGYIRRLNAEGLNVWCFPSELPRVPFDLFRRRCTDEGIVGVYFEGGSQLLSEMMQNREIDYLFCYRAPMLFADDKAKAVLRGFRTEKMDQAIRLSQVKHASHGDDQLMRGMIQYPEKLSVDETIFSHS
jgi:diaminohydroxyphosphoribosylaminopyrimidine deaminase / 5-amino-6-(5-phosphoribosylamino)uracil reductase